MKEFISIQLEGDLPLVAAAIHDGHDLSDEVSPFYALSAAERFREEDPFTGLWTAISGNRILVRHSRFEVDLNRPPETAVYLESGDAWGLNVWKSRPPAELLEFIMRNYREAYRKISEALSALVDRFGIVVVYDLHSYNFRRGGPQAPPEDPAANPEINVGTGTLDRRYWAPILDRFMKDLQAFDFIGRRLDVRENIKFKGGYFPLWIHEQFPGSVCCISIEVKKFYMDEWSGEPYRQVIDALGDALKNTTTGVMEEITSFKTTR